MLKDPLLKRAIIVACVLMILSFIMYLLIKKEIGI